MINLGTKRPGSTFDVLFDTYAGSTGASITMTGLAVTDIEIYKDASVTQRSSDNGYTLIDTDGIDIDGITGIHGFSVSLADNSVAGFYSAGSRYFIIVSAVTVDSQTVNLSYLFDIGYPDAFLNTTIATLASQTSFTLTVGPAEDDALNGCTVLIHDVASAVQLGWGLVSDYTGSTKTVTLLAGVTFTAAATDNISVYPARLLPTVAGRTLDISSGGEAGLDWANIGSPTTAQNLSATNIDVDQVVASVSGAVASVTGLTAATVHSDLDDIQARLPAALTAGGNIKADVLAISGDATAADNAEAFFDGTGYAGTNNVIPLVTTATTATNLTNAPTSGDLTATMKASVNTEVLDVLNTDTFAEPGQESPPATTTLVKKLGYLYKFLRNRKTQTATLLSVYADDATTVDQKATVSDNGTTLDSGEIGTGP